MKWTVQIKLGLSPRYNSAHINRLQKTMLDGKIKHGKEFQIPIGYNTKLNNNIQNPSKLRCKTNGMGKKKTT